jgi:hypothetical protein
MPLLAASLSVHNAHAQDADIAQARQLGQQAQASYDSGNFAESEKYWAAAAKLYSAAPTLTLGLARTQTKLGKFVAAQESYNRILREWSTVASPPPAFKDALEAAKNEVAAVSTRIASVIVNVEGSASPTVTIDGQPVPAAALGLKRPVDPGTHTVKVSAEGAKPVEQTFKVAEGGTAETTLKLESLTPAASSPPPPVQASVAAAKPTTPAPTAAAETTPPSKEAPVQTRSKTLPLIAFGVGGAGLVLGAVTGGLALSKRSTLKNHCVSGACPADQQSNVDSYNGMATLSTVGFIVAGAGGIAGVVLLVAAPKATTAAAGPGLQPYVGLASAGVTGRF